MQNILVVRTSKRSSGGIIALNTERKHVHYLITSYICPQGINEALTLSVVLIETESGDNTNTIENSRIDTYRFELFAILTHSVHESHLLFSGVGSMPLSISSTAAPIHSNSYVSTIISPFRRSIFETSQPAAPESE